MMSMTYLERNSARMAEQEDAVDSKSTARKGVRVRLSLRAPGNQQAAEHKSVAFFVGFESRGRMKRYPMIKTRLFAGRISVDLLNEMHRFKGSNTYHLERALRLHVKVMKETD
jgi:hypothetical protein